MDAYLLDWANLLLRWTHVIVAIAWIGASFYFVFLDLSLTPPQSPELRAQGVDGELWAVHGGGFYNPQKYLVAPQRLPDKLHWFYWESYSTWLTGFALFTVLYLMQAATFLVDRRLHDWSPAAAVAAALAFLVVFWLVYDGVCRVFGERRGGDRVVGALVALAVALGAELACRWFAGRAAFLIVGAMMATAMTANVAVWIIPGQRKVIAQMRAGEPVDPRHGRRAKQRSVHNTYFTLPVLIAMLSNHYGFLYGAPHNAAVLLAVMAAGALIRHSFVARHQALVQGRRVPWEYAAAGTLLLAGVAAWLAPPRTAVATTQPVRFDEVRAVVERRCVPCHNAQLFNKNVQLHTPALIAQHAMQIYQQAVVARTMPLNNATQITEGERALLKRWVEAGAPTQ
ncbi:MAG TPA: urate hydroxylase PuuD [Albitalea sp.]|nr:urate hydroxylase PuuD [Albitalea sp.]